MKKLLILAIYPAPYRVELIESLKREFYTDVFFESTSGDEREQIWFSEGSFHIINTKNGAVQFKKATKNITSYNLVVFYDFSTKNSVRLILKCILKKIPYVINCDGIMLSPHGNPVFDLVKKVLISHASACLASGENAKKYFLKYSAKENRVFTHTFSTLHSEDILETPVVRTEKNELRKKLGLPQDRFISIAVGRFIPLKRYDCLISEWKNMPENHLLLLIGSGTEEEKYREIIKNNGIKNVVIESFYPKDELFNYYKASDAFVHPTSYDVWGLVLNEAFACGLPAIVSDHCVAGLELIKNGENGFLVPMGNDALLCENVIKISKDDSIYDSMSRAALNTIMNYTIENMAKTHINVFRELIKNER